MVRLSLWASVLAASAAISSPASAAALTCETFKSRLWDAISTAGDKVAQVKVYTLRSDADGIRNYDWHGIVGLDGSLECEAKSDHLIGFRVTIDVTDKSVSIPALPRMRDLASAAMCSLVDATPQACEGVANKMLDASASQMSADIKRGEPDPKGASDYDLTPHGWWASVSVDDTLLIFGFGSGTKGTEERLKIDPVAVD